MATTVFVLLEIFLSQAKVITPTFDDGVTQVYDTVVPNEYEWDDIICNKTICHIICDEYRGCYVTYIYASNADHLILECTGNSSSCMYLNIREEPKQSVNITCIGSSYWYSGSCYFSDFGLYQTKLVNLYCDEYSCADVDLHIDEAQNVFVSCMGIYSCNDMDIYISSVLSDLLNLDCDSEDSTSCSNVDIHCDDTGYKTMIIYDDNATEWECDPGYESRGCCPFDTVYPLYECTSNLPCEIDCSQQDCSFWQIDASKASSLLLHCSISSSFDGCRAALIRCPSVSGSSCNIICSDPYSCEYMYVESTSTDQMVNISCFDVHSCSDATIVLDESMNKNQLHLYCGGSGSCYYMNIYLDIFRANIFCTGWWSCVGINLHASNTEAVFINCSNEGSCWWTNIYATNTNLLELNCSNAWSCYLANVFCPYHNTMVCNINCGDFDESCNGMDIHVNDDYVINYLNLQCPNNVNDTNHACDDVEVYCDADGTYSEKSSVNLIFNENDNQYEWDQQSSSYCSPIVTLEPTLEPTSATPTSAPTSAAPTTRTSTPTSTPTRGPRVHASSRDSSLITICYIFIAGFILIVIIIIVVCIKRKRDKSHLNGKSSVEMENKIQSNKSKLSNQQNKNTYTYDIVDEDEKNIDLQVDTFNESEYKLWSESDVYKWIISLKNGDYKKYDIQLKNEITKIQKVKGIHLDEIDKNDIYNWGIVQFEDKQYLFKQIQRVIHSYGNSNNQPYGSEGIINNNQQNNTAYPLTSV